MVIDDIDLFESMGDAAFARSMHESNGPCFFFVLTEQGRPVGRIGVVAEPSCPPDLRRGLPELEYRMFGCMLPQSDDSVQFVGEALASLPSDISPYVDAVTNPEFHGDTTAMRSAFEHAGMHLFQEKHSYHWDDPGTEVEVPNRLTFADIDDIGDDVFAEIIGRTGEETLDRNDRWYRDQTGAANWGRVFLSYLTDDHRDSWLVGLDRRGDAVGFIAISDSGGGDPTAWDRIPAATIPMMGVLPEHRGNGYVDDLLAAATAAAQRKGFVSMIDTVDTLNAPMDQAMIRGGHRRGVRPWHVWHHRAWL
jgi:ribosomal protein S18 acetylase RimI-like enzyme